MIDTFLFDLDGTLLPMDTNEFINVYFKELCFAFSDIIPPKELVKHVMTATEAMIENLEYITNEQVFMKEFSRLIGGDISPYMERFDSFYSSRFENVRAAAHQLPFIRDCIKTLKGKRYNTAIATNPLFPRTAIHKRIVWSGLDIEDFSYISSYECCHYCKPKIEFYEEVLHNIGKKPEQCIMVGNDVQEDLIASRLGIETFLITDHMINRNNEEIRSTYTGNYMDFCRFVQESGNI